MMFDSDKLSPFKINLKNFFLNKKRNTLFSKKRGVSEVIATILLLGITVVGAAMLSISIQDSDIGNVAQFSPTVGSTGSTSASIKLMGYDTRDTQPGEPLAGISGLENIFNGTGQLCTVTCDPLKDDLPLVTPTVGGTEFIILEIKNMALQNITVRGVVINDLSHTWDTVQPGTCLDLTSNLPAGNYPASGTFSFLVPDTSCTSLWRQFISNVLSSGAEVTILVKLSSVLGAPNDIPLNTPLRVSMDTEKQDFDKFLILSGSMK